MEAFGLHANLVNSNVVRAVRRRGNLNNGANYGPRYVNANNATSNANWNYGSGHYPLSSQTTSNCLNRALLFQGSCKGIEIPSDWNRLGRTKKPRKHLLPVCRCTGVEGMKRHETCRAFMGKVLQH